MERRIDFWKTTFRLAGRMRAFGTMKLEFSAHVMESDDRMVPAGVGAQKRMSASYYSTFSTLRRLSSC